MTPEHIASVLTNEIYKRLFAKTSAELLAIAGVSDDESLRDCFSIEALQALSKVEGRAAIAIQAVKYEAMNEKQLASLLAYVVTSICNAVAKGTINPFEGE